MSTPAGDAPADGAAALPLASAAPTAAAAPSIPSPTDVATKVLCEGKARIPFTGDEGVFYNKVQQYNRDLSILVITAFTQRRQQEWTAQQQKPKRPRHTRSPSSSLSASSPPPSSPSFTLPHLTPSPHPPSSPSSPPTPTPFPTSSPPDASPPSPLPPSPPLPPFPGLRMLEGLSATGLRSIRYFLELPHVSSIVVNDFDPAAVASIHRHLAYNHIPLTSLIPSHADAKLLMYAHTSTPSLHFDVIDLDPYGSACEFLDSAVQAVADGGLLAITCTDKAVLCGAWGEVAYAKYGGYALKGKSCHEGAIRLVLGALQSAAARYRRHIQPLLSLSIDFYVRVFVRVVESQMQVKGTASRTAVVYQCTGCEAHHMQRMGRMQQGKGGQAKHTAAPGPPCPMQCADCGSAFRLGGPMWADALHEPAFIDEALASLASNPTRFATHGRISAMLGVARKELATPFYYSLSGLCHTLHCVQPKIWVLRAGLLHAGYECSDTHALPDGIKTTAPSSVVWDVMRGYLQQFPDALGKHIRVDSPAAVILSKPPASAAVASLVHLSTLSPLPLLSLTSPTSSSAAVCARPASRWTCRTSTVVTRPPGPPEVRSSHSAALTPPPPSLLPLCPLHPLPLPLTADLPLSFVLCSVAKFLPNPEHFWGPKQRAKRTKREEVGDEEKAGERAADGVDDSLPAQQKRAKLMQGWKKKKRPCERFFSAGHCRFGDNCKFSHEPRQPKATEEHKDGLHHSADSSSEQGAGEEEEHPHATAAEADAAEPPNV